MNSEKISDLILSYLTSKSKGLEFEKALHPNGDFGDLVDIDFHKGTLMGHFGVWSNGYVFYNLFDSSKDENWEIIEETLLDTSKIKESDIEKHLENTVLRITDMIDT
ncbi:MULTISPECIES: hypothetical protein [Rhizobium/Agrobacterium group]|uniref:hypothetical protein n=1 Tax=Rhizobium/Agrobacterium group TaxID=227290 RepID=UPI000B3FACC2|nr:MULTISPECIES: hypothetical protein [Rhizobium/Agrobacterium group]MCF1484514.1 hypothetical protein [Allorhizobium ampelinum]NSZ43178.1 hypothetical protein [Agrobacterium vitis]NTA26835.1 hypothetical protein [Allorhizobium ampelinum]OVE94660.1 hypothetical protein B7W85_10050 [Allorhizobium ampelinum]